MRSTTVAGIIFANAYDESLARLTEKRSIASVPFGGRYRLIDFSLSNLVNANITNIGIITKEKYRSLMDHIGSGVHWDLDRKSGGVRILPPFNISGTRQYQGFVEALYNSMDFIHKCGAEHIVICDSRVVANVDVDKVIKQHISQGADVTAVCHKGAPLQNGDDTMIVTLDGENNVKSTEFPWAIPAEEMRTLGIFVFKRDMLIELVQESYESGGNSICKDIIAEHLDELKVIAYIHTGFAAVMDCPKTYIRTNMRLLDAEVRRDLFNSERPIYTKTRDDMPTRYGTKSQVKNSFIAEGCVIDGTVKNSILFRGVKVEKGAVVENSIIMQGVSIGKDAVLDKVVSDKNAVIGDGMVIKGTDEKAFLVAKNQIL